MFTLFVVLPIVLVVFGIALVIRVLTLPFRLERRLFRSRSVLGSGLGYNRGLGYGRRRGIGGPILTILSLVALDRFFGRRW